MSDLPVLIVGAGPTGLAAAIELARSETPFRIIDRLAGVAPHSRAIGIQARTLEYFDRLGIADDFLAAGTPWHGLSVYSERKRTVHVTFAGIPSRFNCILSVPQDVTETLLGNALAARGGRIEREVELTAVTPQDGGCDVVLRHADGSLENVRAQYVVGADGAHSEIRRASGQDFAGATMSQATFALADLRVEGFFPPDEITILAAGDVLCAAFPLPHGRMRLITGHIGARDASAEPDLAEFQTIVDAAVPEDARLYDAIWMTRFRINQRKSPRYSVGRLFLAGDAAHIHSPQGAQGMNTGIQDAVNLAWKLALVVSGRAAPALLDAYHEERSPVGEQLIRMTDIGGLVMTLEPAVLKFFRDRLATLATSVPAVQHLLQRGLSEVAIGYRKSPIVLSLHEGAFERWKHGLRAGDRAPDVTFLDETARPVRLYDLLHPFEHVVLVFADTHAETPAPLEPWIRALERFPGFARIVAIRHGTAGSPEASHVKSVLDSKGLAYEAFRVHRSAAAIVRPDAYVGAYSATADPGLLDEYAAKLGLIANPSTLLPT